MPTWPVDVRSKVTRLSLEPLHFLDELPHEDALSTLHQDRGHERPRRDDHVQLLTAHDATRQLVHQILLLPRQVVDVPTSTGLGLISYAQINYDYQFGIFIHDTQNN